MHEPIVKIVAPDRPDLQVVRAAIDECRQHRTLCATQTPRAKALRLIDCRTRRVVVSERHCPYVCLSYVWGSSAIEPLQTNGGLPRNVPKTIEDALFAVQELGIPFMWADKYCIDQNDPIEKHNVIRDMHRIYQGAELIIIATSADPDDGLPGMRGTPRMPPCRLDFGNKIYLGVPVVT